MHEFPIIKCEGEYKMRIGYKAIVKERRGTIEGIPRNGWRGEICFPNGETSGHTWSDDGRCVFHGLKDFEIVGPWVEEETKPAEGVEATLNERGKRYGEFAEHARIAQELKHVMRSKVGWDALSPDKKEALEMVAHKVARILNGDPNYADSWHDIAGYATLVEKKLSAAHS